LAQRLQTRIEAQKTHHSCYSVHRRCSRPCGCIGILENDIILACRSCHLVEQLRISRSWQALLNIRLNLEIRCERGKIKKVLPNILTADSSSVDEPTFNRSFNSKWSPRYESSTTVRHLVSRTCD